MTIPVLKLSSLGQMVYGECHLGPLRGESVGLQRKQQRPVDQEGPTRSPIHHCCVPPLGALPGVGKDRTARVGGLAWADCIDTVPKFEEV